MYKQRLIILVFIVGLLLGQPAPLLPSLAEPTNLVEVAKKPPIRLGGLGASEEKTIDTFDVHPANRWEITNDGMSAEVDNSSLMIYDTGDGSNDNYHIVRNLTAREGTIEVNFMYSTNTDNNDSVFDCIYVELLSGGSTQSSVVQFLVRGIGYGNSTTQLAYQGVTGVSKSLTLDSDEQCYNDTWYRLRLDFDFYKSKLRWRLYFDNDSEVFDYEWQDIDEMIPRCFEDSWTAVHLYTYCKTTSKLLRYYINYVEASFRQRNWVKTDDPTLAGWEVESYDHAEASVGTDVMQYELVVPYLDSVSFDMWVDINETIESAEWAYVMCGVYGVIASNGTKRLQMYAALMVLNTGSGGGVRSYFCYSPDDIVHTQYDYTGWTVGENPRVSGSFETRDDRSVLVGYMKIWEDYQVGSEDNFQETSYVYDMEEDYSEYIVYTQYGILGLESGEYAIMGFDSLAIVERNLFIDLKGLGPAAGRTGGSSGGSFDLLEWFVAIVRWLGGLIGSFITDPLKFIVDTIGFLWNTLSTIVGDIVGQFIAYIGTFLSDAITWLTGALATVADFLLSVVNAIIDLFIPAEIQALFTWMVTGMVQFFTGLPQLLTDWMTFIVAVFALASVIGFLCFFIFPIAQGDDVGGFLTHMFDNMGFDITFGLSIIGFQFKVPAVIPWLFVVVFTMLVGTPYFGFF